MNDQGKKSGKYKKVRGLLTKKQEKLITMYAKSKPQKKNPLIIYPYTNQFKYIL